ncbi:MAG TPA: hypothetical protein VLQ80_02850 [Candidatus Saccharimonadia bacterium]|nr:hypothetical protein [Candidatus Saccharimonadia bacterium]
MPLASKTRTVLSRLPDFYQADTLETVFAAFVDVFGQALEQAETDLLAVLRSHWVDTAGNVGSEGLDRARQGDLDKILAFYLENLGGTSQFTQVTWLLVAQDITNLASLVSTLQRAADPVSRYLKAQFRPATLHRLHTYDPAGPPGQNRAALVEVLIADLNAIITRAPLYQADRFASVPVSPDLQARLRQRPEPGSAAMVRLNYALLMAAYPDALTMSYATYRERLKGMIGVIAHGASTVEGIITVVAANLGITGDDPRARQARDGIRVVEFWPRPMDLVPIMPDTDTAIPLDGGLLLREVFELCNPNLVESHEGGDQELHMHINPALSAPISNLRLVHRTSGIFWQYNGTVHPGDHLTLFQRRSSEAATPSRLMPEWPPWLLPLLLPLLFSQVPQRTQTVQTVCLNGRPLDPSAWEGTIPPVPPGKSRWRFDQAATDPDLDPRHSRLSSVKRPLARFAEAANPEAGGRFAAGEIAIAALRVRLPRLTPGTFTVRIPWDIPGYTDRYAEFDDHPRHQMKYIVGKVKAAGVQTAIVYEKTFAAEAHEMSERALRARATWTNASTHDLDASLRPLTATWTMAEAHEPRDAGFTRVAWHSTEALPADDSLTWQVDTDRIEHDMTDTLAISGVFSHTRFDQSIFLR